MSEEAQRRIAQARELGLTTLELTHVDLKGFPKEVLELEQLTHLKLHGTFKAPPAGIVRLQRLRRLQLGGSVRRLPASMADMPALERLELNSAHLLPEGLERLRQLKALHLFYGRFAELDDRFAGLEALEELSIAGGLGPQKLRALPPSIGALARLRALDVGYNHELGALPDELCGLAALETLIAPWCGLERLPERLGALRALRRLELHQNRLEALPASFAQLTRLERLSLHHNRLRELPPGVGLLPAFRGKVDLSHNPIERLPEPLGQGQTTRLSLSGQKLAELPSWVCGLTQLEELDLSGAGLTALPEAIGALRALRRLNLSGNPLETLPESIGRLTRLEVLSLRRCGLTRLPGSIGGLKRLVELELSSNRLTALPDSLTRLGALRELRVDGNALERLPEAIGELRSLRLLHLHHNQLTALPASARRLHLWSNDTEDESLMLPDDDADPGLTVLGNPWAANEARDGEARRSSAELLDLLAEADHA